MAETVHLSFDVEEFDIPGEYGQPICLEQQIEVSRRGLQRIAELVAALNIQVTFFCTAIYARHDTEQIGALGAHHEIASHGWSHAAHHEGDLARSRQLLRKITGQQVVGFRRARLQPTQPDELHQAGYSYDSSLNPTYLPGRYNCLDQPRQPFRDQTIVQLPISTTPHLRLPLFWLTFKNVPARLYDRWCHATLDHDGSLNLFFHPWEFVDLRDYCLPRLVKRIDAERLCDRLTSLIERLKGRAHFHPLRSLAATVL